MPENGNESKPSGIRINLNLWHVIILLAFNLISTSIAVGARNEKIEELDRSIQEIKSERYIPRTDYNDRVQELEHQIERLEGKIDALTHLVK